MSVKEEGCGRMSQTTLYKKISMVGCRAVTKEGNARVSTGPFLFVEPHQRAHKSIGDACVWSTIDKFDQFMEQVDGATSQPKANTF